MPGDEYCPLQVPNLFLRPSSACCHVLDEVRLDSIERDRPGSRSLRTTVSRFTETLAEDASLDGYRFQNKRFWCSCGSANGTDVVGASTALQGEESKAEFHYPQPQWAAWSYSLPRPRSGKVFHEALRELLRRGWVLPGVEVAVDRDVGRKWRWCLSILRSEGHDAVLEPPWCLFGEALADSSSLENPRHRPPGERGSALGILGCETMVGAWQGKATGALSAMRSVRMRADVSLAARPFIGPFPPGGRQRRSL